MVQVDFQYLHYFLVLEFLEFGLEMFPVFVHFWIHVVHIPLFEHQQETKMENYEFLVDLELSQALQEPVSVEGFIEGSADGVPMFVTDVDSQNIVQRNVHG